MTEQTALLHIAVDHIEENPNALREVDTESKNFETLVDSIGRNGVLNPISVSVAYLPDGKTPKTQADGTPVYRLVDGLHRWTASKHAGCKTIPAQVLKKTEQAVMVAQLVANAQKIETKPYEYSQQLIRILANDQTMTVQELANLVSETPDWITKRLGLASLSPAIGAEVDAGNITVTNAVELAKLRPTEEQEKFLKEAMEDAPQVFGPKIKARIKELRAAKREGRNPEEAGKFVAIPHLRKPAELKAELESPNVLPQLLAAQGIETAEEAAAFTVRWALHMDEESLTEARAKHEARKAKDEADKQRRKVERDAKRAEELRTKLAAVESGN